MRKRERGVELHGAGRVIRNIHRSVCVDVAAPRQSAFILNRKVAIQYDATDRGRAEVDDFARAVVDLAGVECCVRPHNDLRTSREAVDSSGIGSALNEQRICGVQIVASVVAGIYDRVVTWVGGRTRRRVNAAAAAFAFAFAFATD